MKRLLMIAASTLPLAFATAAPAQQRGDGAARRDCALAKKQGRPCQITFTVGDTLEGGVAAPGGEDVMIPKDTFFGSLLRLRWDFRAEIVASVEDL